jgi:hypothetical protein
MPVELSKILAEWESLSPEERAESEAESRERCRRTVARINAYIGQELQRVPEHARHRFERVPLYDLRRQTLLYAAGRPPAPPQVRSAVSRPRERRERRTARTVGSRGDPDEPPSVIDLRGFMPASVRMVRHLARRRAKAAAA